MADQTSGSPQDQPRREPGGERELIEAALEAASPQSSWPEDPADWAKGHPLPAPGTFPGYELVREIHRGGQGVVYQAIQVTTRRRVAVKVMHAGPFMGSSGRARFEREVQVLGQLDHPNIVRIHGSGTTADGSCFYVMDYVSGKPLDALIESGRLPVREALRLLAKVCDAVNAAHLKGVIHRDLKPANIRINESGEPVVVDFGLAKTAVPELEGEDSPRLMSMTGQFIGSLPWASPEQADGSPAAIDVRTDVYSLGVIAYQLLTGRFPYEVAGAMRDVLDNILRAQPARPSTIRRQINDEVETIVLKALAKERERRYQSAGDLGRDIRRFLEGQPIEAKRDSGWYVITKTLRRYRVPAGLGAAALAGLVAFAVIAAVLYERAQSARVLADQRADQLAAARDASDRNLSRAWELAELMVFDLYDAIDPLRGATRAKTLLLEDAVATLTAIEADAIASPTQRRDLALARVRLGELLVGATGGLHRTGELDRGRSLYDAADAALSTLASEHPATLEARARLAAARGYLAMLEGDWGRALSAYDRALGALDGAIEAADRADAADPQPVESRRQLVMRRAEVLVEMGHTRVRAALNEGPARAGELVLAADSSFDRARGALRSLARAGRLDPEPARRLARVDLRDSTALLLRGRTRSLAARDAPADAAPRLAGEGVELLDRAAAVARNGLAVVDALAADDPASGVLARDRFALLHNVGEAHMRAAAARRRLTDIAQADAQDPQALLADAGEDDRRAMEAYERALALATAAADADEANALLRRDVALALNKVGRQALHLGERARAQGLLERSLALREELLRTEGTAEARDAVAVACYRLGRLHEDKAEADAADLERALSYYQRAASHMDALVDSGVADREGGRAAVIGRAVRRVRDALGGG